jgi:drug/metabolite transporter (DMT)-like permease
MASTLVWVVARATSSPLTVRHLFDRWVLLRTLTDTLATITYLVSLFHLPIANATAINMAVPIMIALLAGPMLGERVGARRWLLIGAGFTGVLLVVQPGPSGFNAYAWLCVFATVVPNPALTLLAALVEIKWALSLVSPASGAPPTDTVTRAFVVVLRFVILNALSALRHVSSAPMLSPPVPNAAPTVAPSTFSSRSTRPDAVDPVMPVAVTVNVELGIDVPLPTDTGPPRGFNCKG